ncbi:MAG: benzene 1,2-dioxygenase [Lysobacterales bacterium CG02_land_8_20_14_3_00_62_12]|nr:MAG: benzene 1,2-dioxygenase [Xanthomonadales bacterium CG02_land_8_20_14_3_00_62_12]
MALWTRVCGLNELAPGEHRVTDIEGALVAVFNIDGDFYAIEDVCTHDGAQLTGGPVIGHLIECPRHGAQFDVRSGVAVRGPAYAPISRFPIKLEADAIWSRDDRWD